MASTPIIHKIGIVIGIVIGVVLLLLLLLIEFEDDKFKIWVYITYIIIIWVSGDLVRKNFPA